MKYSLLFFLLLIFYPNVPAQAPNLVYVDSNGGIKWAENKIDVYFFGVNYTLPFAFSYRAYPIFLPYRFESGPGGRNNNLKAESIQVAGRGQRKSKGS